MSERLDQLRQAVPTLLLEGAVAGLAWWLAQQLLGDDGAFFAPIAAVLTLGLGVEQRGARALAVAIGVAVGLTIAALIVDGIGSGPWQLGLVIVLARVAAILADGSMVAINQATISAVLVVTLHADGVFPGDRLLCALIGAGLALGAVAVMPRPSGPGSGTRQPATRGSG
jgi:uncharacterized membrane protein YgaE (UPF0421/DUF939 family)